MRNIVLITPEGRFILVNMDQCQDLMGGGCSSTLHWWKDENLGVSLHTAPMNEENAR